MTNTILIIGAGPGIGQATAKRFGREGWRVALAARDLTKLEALVAELRQTGIAAAAHKIDAADGKDMATLVERVGTTKDAPLATVHFNAAILRPGGIGDLTDERIASELLVDIGGALHAIRAARAVFAGRGGTVLLTGGGFALHPNPDYLMIGLGKAGVRHIAEALHAPLAAEGIHLATLTISSMITPGSRQAEEVADAFWALQTQSREGWTWEASYG